MPSVLSDCRSPRKIMLVTQHSMVPGNVPVRPLSGGVASRTGSPKRNIVYCSAGVLSDPGVALPSIQYPRDAT